MRNEIILEKINQAVATLNEIDNLIDTQSVELQNVDLKLSDLYHLIENNELGKESSAKIVDDIHDLRVLRRSLHNEHEIEMTYNTHKSKLTGKETRQFLLAEVHKTIKSLSTEYKNRILSDEDVQNYLEPSKKKRGRPLKSLELDNEREN